MIKLQLAVYIKKFYRVVVTGEQKTKKENIKTSYEN